MPLTARFKAGAWSALKVLFAVGLIYWMISSDKINFSAFSAVFHPLPFILCIVLVALSTTLATERWRVLARGQGLALRFYTAIRLSLIGLFFNFAMPGGVGGDVVKAYYVTRENPERKVDSALNVLIDRVVGLYAMILMAAVAMFLDFEKVMALAQLRFLFFLTLILAFVSSLFFALAFSSRVRGQDVIWSKLKSFRLGQIFMKIYDSVHVYGQQKTLFVKALLYSWASQGCTVLLMAVVGGALSTFDIPLSAYFFVCPLGMMITAIPISPAGVGVGQAAFYYLFNLYLGTSTDLGPNVMTIFQIFQFGFGLIGAGFYLRMKR